MKFLLHIRQAFGDRAFVGKYLLLGVINTVLHFGGFWFFYELLDMWYLAAATLAFIVRYAAKFALVRSWLFGTRIPGSIPSQVVRFSLIELFFLGASLVLMAFLVEILRMPPFWALVATSFVTSMSSLVTTRVVFNPDPAARWGRRVRRQKAG